MTNRFTRNVAGLSVGPKGHAESGDVVVSALLGDRVRTHALLSELTSTERVRTADVAAYHGVLGAAAPVLMSDNSMLAALVKRRLVRGVGAVMRAIIDLKMIADAFEGLPWAVVKGPALGARYYESTSHRLFDDVDILLPESAVDEALHRLATIGTVPTENWRLTDSAGVGEIAFHLPHGTALDLHWHLIHHARIRRQFDFPTQSLLERVVPIDIDGVTVPTLDHQDALTHTALHAMLSGGHRLVWSDDLRRIVQSEQVDWSILTERAQQAGAGTVLAVMLARSRAVLGTPVKDEQIRDLAGRTAWLKVTHLLELWRPQAGSFGRMFNGQVIVRSTRATTAGSLAALFGLSWTSVLKPLLTDSDHPWRQRMRRK